MHLRIIDASDGTGKSAYSLDLSPQHRASAVPRPACSLRLVYVHLPSWYHGSGGADLCRLHQTFGPGSTPSLHCSQADKPAAYSAQPVMKALRLSWPTASHRPCPWPVRMLHSPVVGAPWPCASRTTIPWPCASRTTVPWPCASHGLAHPMALCIPWPCAPTHPAQPSLSLVHPARPSLPGKRPARAMPLWVVQPARLACRRLAPVGPKAWGSMPPFLAACPPLLSPKRGAACPPSLPPIRPC